MMSDLYRLQAAGVAPVTLAEAKAYMRVASTADDALLGSMLLAVTKWGENYTGKEFRANTWKLFTDCFQNRIALNRAPVASITTVQHVVGGTLATVPDATYYLKKNLRNAEVLLQDGEAWPTDTDPREQAVEIVFVTEALDSMDIVKIAILHHLAYWYANRGDCSCEQAVEESGAIILYDPFRTSRV